MGILQKGENIRFHEHFLVIDFSGKEIWKEAYNENDTLKI